MNTWKVIKKLAAIVSLTILFLSSTSPAEASQIVLIVADDHSVGYDRSLFKHWIDADKDGCDTRNEVLIEEAIVKPKVGKKCSLAGGLWTSPYDWKTVNSASALDMVHLVPLAEAGAPALGLGHRTCASSTQTNYEFQPL